MIHLVYAKTADVINAAQTRCYVGDPPDNIPPPYSFVWGPLPLPKEGDLAGTLQDVDFRFYLQVVDVAAADVLARGAELAAVLQDRELQIPGYTVFPLKVVATENVQTAKSSVNQETNRFPAWLTLELRFQAVKN